MRPLIPVPPVGLALDGDNNIVCKPLNTIRCVLKLSKYNI